MVQASSFRILKTAIPTSIQWNEEGMGDGTGSGAHRILGWLLLGEAAVLHSHTGYRVPCPGLCKRSCDSPTCRLSLSRNHQLQLND